MPTLLQVLISILLTAVAVILSLGMWNLMRGGSPNKSQTLMRMRILFQFLAVVAVMAALYFVGGR